MTDAAPLRTAEGAATAAEATLAAAEPAIAGAASRRPGRPRREDIEERVLAAVIELIDEEQTVTVNAVVERSGVSRAAVYRRWDTLAKLTAAALDVGRSPVAVPEGIPVRDALGFGYPQAATEVLGSYPEKRMRQRLRLGLGDRELQHEYWRAHVARRREPIAAALAAGRDRGELREDADIEAALDLLSGVYYYQLVARGASLTDPETLARCRAAVEIVWRGIAAS